MIIKRMQLPSRWNDFFSNLTVIDFHYKILIIVNITHKLAEHHKQPNSQHLFFWGGGDLKENMNVAPVSQSPSRCSANLES